jgi:hypothetical protein
MKIVQVWEEMTRGSLIVNSSAELRQNGPRRKRERETGRHLEISA